MAQLLYPSSTAGAAQGHFGRSQLLPPLLRYVCVGRNGATVRAGAAMDSASVGLLPSGAVIDVAEAVDVGATRRLRLARSGDGALGSGWVSAKLFAYDGQSGHANPFRAAADAAAAPRKARAAKAAAPFAFVAPTGSGSALLFPGQGAQKVGMLAPYKDVPGVAALFAEASEIFGVDLLDVVENGPAETLNDTRYSQVCVFLTSLAAAMKLQSDDPSAIARATVTAGFSLGEYTALVFAGVVDTRTALELLRVRANAMGAACDAAPSGMMTVLGLDDARLEAMLPAGVSIANQLFPKGRVLSGAKEGLAAVADAVSACGVAGAKATVLAVSGAFHSPYMAPAAAALEAALAEATFSAPARTVYSNASGKPHSEDPAEIKAAMVRQLTAGVLWEDTIRDMGAAFPGVELFYEPAPGRQLGSMMRRIAPANKEKMRSV